MRQILPLALLAFSTACASAGPRGLYEWGDYSRVSLQEARGSLTKQQHADALRAIVARGEAANRVPPGLYAELGFALMELGDRAGAVEWFGKERARWPESTVFMNQLIAVATDSAQPPSAPTNPAPPAGATAPEAPIGTTPPPVPAPPGSAPAQPVPAPAAVPVSPTADR